MFYLLKDKLTLFLHQFHIRYNQLPFNSSPLIVIIPRNGGADFATWLFVTFYTCTISVAFTGVCSVVCPLVLYVCTLPRGVKTMGRFSSTAVAIESLDPL